MFMNVFLAQLVRGDNILNTMKFATSNKVMKLSYSDSIFLNIVFIDHYTP